MKVALKTNQPCSPVLWQLSCATCTGSPWGCAGPLLLQPLTRGSRTTHRGSDQGSLNRNGAEAGASCSDQPGSGATCLQHITPWPCWGLGPVAPTQKASISLLSFFLWDTVWEPVNPVSLGSSLGYANARGSGGDILWEQWLVTSSSCSCPLPSTGPQDRAGLHG